jgi:hypothetical protein
MTRKDIDNIISIICPNDEDFEKPIISPAYLKKELETLALEQEPSGDLISGQAVLDLCDMRDRYEIPYEYDEGGKHIKGYDEGRIINVTKLKMLPPVKQEPKTGHWITKEAYSEDKAMGITEQIVCSNCDMQNSYFSEWDECKNPISKTFIRSKYCPNCGARMVEPQESEDKE